MLADHGIGLLLHLEIVDEMSSNGKNSNAGGGRRSSRSIQSRLGPVNKTAPTFSVVLQ